MAAQLPSEAAGVAGVVLVWSFFCLAASLLLLWLAWVHNERTSYVALLAFFTSLSTSVSITQDILTIVSWVDVRTAEFWYQKAHAGNPELGIAGPSTGLDLVLNYIQFYTYNVESILFLLWAIDLTRSVFQFRGMIQQVGHRGQALAKVGAVALPIVQVCVLRTDIIQSSTPVFLILANCIMIPCLTVGSILLLVILVKYVHAKQSFPSWDVQHDKSTNRPDTADDASAYTGTELAVEQHCTSIYDKWVVVRFATAFLMLGGFQLVTILLEVVNLQKNSVPSPLAQPDLSAGRARTDLALSIPGVTASVLAFVVFGTTRTFLGHLWKIFVPRRIREYCESKRLADRVPSVVLRPWMPGG